VGIQNTVLKPLTTDHTITRVASQSHV